MDALRKILWALFGIYAMLMPVAYLYKVGPTALRGNALNSIDASLGLLMFLAVPWCLMFAIDKVLDKLE